MPQRGQTSMVRTPMRSIFGCSILPSVFSMSVQATPRQPRSPASASPTGPAPTIRTGVRVAVMGERFRRRLVSFATSIRAPGAARRDGGFGPSLLVFPLQRVELVLADQALALGKIDRERTSVADLAFLAERTERELHAAQRGLQRQVGIEHAGEAQRLQLLVR